MGGVQPSRGGGIWGLFRAWRVERMHPVPVKRLVSPSDGLTDRLPLTLAGISRHGGRDSGLVAPCAGAPSCRWEQEGNPCAAGVAEGERDVSPSLCACPRGHRTAGAHEPEGPVAASLPERQLCLREAPPATGTHAPVHLLPDSRRDGGRAAHPCPSSRHPRPFGQKTLL